MTAKEKAEELVKKYLLKVKINSRTLGESNVIITNGEIILQTAIQCALIAVDELIKETGSKYWYDVKQEIEKL
jgi:imidazole glycerol phosphate synthase subunit HisF